MILNIDGEINQSYVQNLCLIFFPGEKFSPNEVPNEDSAKLDLKIAPLDSGCYAKVTMSIGEKSATAEHFSEYNSLFTTEKTAKLAVGTALYTCGCKLFNYSPPWGILTGIRPAKVAGQLYSELGTKTAAKKVLCTDYLVSPKKAMLATNIGVFENKLLKISFCQNFLLIHAVFIYRFHFVLRGAPIVRLFPIRPNDSFP